MIVGYFIDGPFLGQQCALREELDPFIVQACDARPRGGGVVRRQISYSVAERVERPVTGAVLLTYACGHLIEIAPAGKRSRLSPLAG